MSFSRENDCMTDDTLFPVGEPRPPKVLAPGTPRVQPAVRNQVEFFQADLDSLIDDDHQARVIVEFVGHLDLSKLYQPIRAFEGGAGRTPIDPRMLLALWLYAALRGVGSARELERLCAEHVAYRWICGGVSVNHHTLADFRSQSNAIFDSIMADSLTVLRSKGVVTLERVAHDGLRTRASAGSGSFRGKDSLEELLADSEAHIKALREELDDDPAGGGKRRKSARMRAARERSERIQEALRQMPDVEAKKKDPKKKARVSITDPSARMMKMPNGGFNPAYNIQLSADTQSQLIVGVNVTNCGSDHALLPQAVAQIEAHAGGVPKETLTDGGFNKPENIEALSERTVVYAPVTEFKDKNGKVLGSKKALTPVIAAWHERMKTEEAKTIYKERASTIECVNALMRNRGLYQVRVRGLERVRATVLLFAIAHNAARAARLRAQLPSG